MPVMSPSLCIGAKQLVYLPPPNRNYFQRKRTRVSMQLQPWSQRNFPSIKAVLSCNAALNSKCSQGQTQTLTREAPTITQAPNTNYDGMICHESSQCRTERINRARLMMVEAE
ncbi:unnamed protein product [Arabis nemorensis]|uniref:Uncharacterized protein n=1 Tax=Arabis nemorensis TaxID=586526 RepID=A0A565AVL6_9BRAS|nr:unnamed protein product [Arabis nemorensis]